MDAQDAPPAAAVRRVPVAGRPRAASTCDGTACPTIASFSVPHAVDNQMFAAAAAPYQHPDVRAAARRRWGIEPDAFVVLFVGKLVPSKRPLNVVRAVARLAPGRDADGRRLRPARGSRCAPKRRGSASRCKMVGFLNQSQLGEPYALADCLTLPSDFPETWGLVVNEALATGLPCVVSNAVGCAPDLIRDGETGYVYPLDDIEALAMTLAKVRHRKAEGHDWGPACRALVARVQLRRDDGRRRPRRRSVLRSLAGTRARLGRRRRGRIIACCGQMVIAGGLERMTFEVLDAARRHGAACHAIVNGWENFRITPLAEASGASWSVGPYWYPLKRRRLTPLVVARMAVEVLRVSVDLLRVSRRVRPTHIFLPDYQAVLRNAPALFWLRARGVRVVARLGNAPAPGRFYRLLWRHVINPFVDRLRLQFRVHPPGAVGACESGPTKCRRFRTCPRGARRSGTRMARACRDASFSSARSFPKKDWMCCWRQWRCSAAAASRRRSTWSATWTVGNRRRLSGHRASLRARAGARRSRGRCQFSRVARRCADADEPRERTLLSQPARTTGSVRQRRARGEDVGRPVGGHAERRSSRTGRHTRDDGWVCRRDHRGRAGIRSRILPEPSGRSRAARAAAARMSAANYSEGRFAAAWSTIFGLGSERAGSCGSTDLDLDRPRARRARGRTRDRRLARRPSRS